MDEAPIRALPLLEEYFPGSLIGGKYRLEAVVGQGGMGSVWRANNVVLDMPLALKLIKPEVRGVGTTQLLLNEARLAAKLQHPSVVRLFDFGIASTGDAYIVMELLRGPSLADLLERHGKISAIGAVQLLLPIVHGLSMAHRKGVVHLDLKPENIVISKVGMRSQPKLLDFGIAKKIGRRNNSADSGSRIGSPAYMSPEQAYGSREIDARADIWGICVVLYELISGRLPFTAETPAETLRAVMEHEPAALDGDADARALWPIVRAGLVKDRERRYGNIHALGAALAQWLIERGEHHDVCGEQLVSSWGPAASARPASKPAADVPARAKKRGRTLWMSAAACLCVAVPAFALLHLDREQRAAITTGVRVAQHSADLSVVMPAAHSRAEVPQLTASTTPDQGAPVLGSIKKPAAVRAPKLSAKRQRPRSREAELGLKDPFE